MPAEESVKELDPLLLEGIDMSELSAAYVALSDEIRYTLRWLKASRRRRDQSTSESERAVLASKASVLLIQLRALCRIRRLFRAGLSAW